MSQNQVNLDAGTLGQMVAAVKKARFGGLKKDIYGSIKVLNVQSISDAHRAALTGVLSCLLKEDVALGTVTATLQSNLQEDEFKHENLKNSFQILIARVIDRREAAGELSDAKKALADAQESVRAITAGITDTNVRNSIEGAANAHIVDDIDAIRWWIVLLSLLAFQASEAKLRCEINDQSAAFEQLKDRIKEMDRLVRSLLSKPQNEHKIGGLRDGLAGISSGPPDSKKTLGFSGGRR